MSTASSNRFHGIIGSDSRDDLFAGVDVCGCERKADLPTSSSKLASASFTLAPASFKFAAAFTFPAASFRFPSAFFAFCSCVTGSTRAQKFRPPIFVRDQFAFTALRQKPAFNQHCGHFRQTQYREPGAFDATVVFRQLTKKRVINARR